MSNHVNLSYIIITKHVLKSFQYSVSGRLRRLDFDNSTEFDGTIFRHGLGHDLWNRFCPRFIGNGFRLVSSGGSYVFFLY